MKSGFALITLISLFSITCEKTDDIEKYQIGEGFEMYLTVTPYTHIFNLDYNTVNLDTMALVDTPMLRYNDLLRYDTITHKLTLNISHDSLKINDAGVYGRMFIVTIDKTPIYCGFKWLVISSVPCNWVHIMEPYEDLDHLKDNEIVISFASETYEDPRLDKRITDRLKKDGKIK